MAGLLERVLSYGVIAGAGLTKLPQIRALCQADQAGHGLALGTPLADLLSCSLSFCCHYAHCHPLSAYAEDYLLAAQDATICCQIARPSRALAAGYAMAYAAAVLVLANIKRLVSARRAAGGLLLCRATVLLLSMVGKLPQIWRNWLEGGTGRLSLGSTALLAVGNLIRVWTGIGLDRASQLSNLVALAANLTLLAQIAHYRQSKSQRDKNSINC